MITKLAYLREERTVQYELSDGPPGDVASVPWMKIEHPGSSAPGSELPWMKIEHPGSSAPGSEHLRFETLKVKGAKVSLVRRQGMWNVEAILVQLIKGGGELLVEHIELGSDHVPMWLANLCAQAVQEDA